ncbi:MAG: hypothetical protein O7J95_18755, partial [Planctomycetota bacterium]|nr:hypothetical protein [Planctomycetota bacterium]
TGGRVRVELQDAGRRPYDGFSLADCTPLAGDAIEAPVAWKGGRDVSALAGKPLRLRFEIRDADVYSFRFR